MNNKDLEEIKEEVKKVGAEVNDFVNQVMKDAEISEVKNNIASSLKNFENIVSKKDNRDINLNVHNKKKSKKGKLALPAEISQYVHKGIPEKVSGVLQTVLGSIGTIGFGTTVTSLFIVGVVTDSVAGRVSNIVGAAFVPLLLISAIFMANGIAKLNSGNRFRYYIERLGNRRFCEIEEFGAIGKSRKFIIKDLQKMIKKRWFFQARFSDDGKYFILDNETYKQYMEFEEQKRIKSKVHEQNSRLEREMSPEVAQVIDAGRLYLIELREVSNTLVETPMGSKLNRLEKITRNIIEKIKKNPEKFAEIRKFMEYYLPTTMKLANAYKEFEKSDFDGDTVVGSKNEIIQTMDKIAVAFENLYDSLFDELAMDISTDISVLETMLVKEGLTDTGFNELK
jgi:5-bromo-4-chloroindolyl phosphate hydrolysis protein.